MTDRGGILLLRQCMAVQNDGHRFIVSSSNKSEWVKGWVSTQVLNRSKILKKMNGDDDFLNLLSWVSYQCKNPLSNFVDRSLETRLGDEDAVGTRCPQARALCPAAKEHVTEHPREREQIRPGWPEVKRKEYCKLLCFYDVFKTILVSGSEVDTLSFARTAMTFLTIY